MRRARYKEDKCNIMTSVLAAARPGHHIRNVETDISVALDPTNGRLLAFQRTQDQSRVKFPLVRGCHDGARSLCAANLPGPRCRADTVSLHAL